MVQPTEPLAELLPPLSAHEAKAESDRCLYCYDAPCTQACPTHIDVPRFIKKIATGNLIGSARAIFDSNLLGASCARVCPVQELCEGACVLGADHKPIAIGRLQRYAMDRVLELGPDRLPIKSGDRSSQVARLRVAVVGAGPAGLSCAGELARLGHSVTVYEKRDRPGGLSTYGIISLREPIDVALREAEMIRGLGVEFEFDYELAGKDGLNELLNRVDAVFLAVGLGGTPEPGIAGQEHIVDGLAFIEQSKLSPSTLAIGRDVVIVGAGNTAIDCATIAKRLGAETVTMLYRRSEREMTAYPHEYEFIKNEGVVFRFLTQPVRVIAQDGVVSGLECVKMALEEPDSSGRRVPRAQPGTEFAVRADQVIKAIGQERPNLALTLGLRTAQGFVEVGPGMETSIPRVFAGGDCVRSSGAASTVMAVQDGKRAAETIHGRARG